MITQYAQCLIRWRLVVVATVIAVMTVAAFGAQYLSFKNDYRMFFSPDDPHLLAFENVQDTYSKNDNVLFVLAPRHGKVFDRDVLAAIETLTREAWQMPHSSRVDSPTNFQHSVAEGDDLRVDDLVRNAGTLAQDELERIERLALAEPLLVNRLLSSSGDVAGVNVTIQLPGVDEGGEVLQVARFARDLAARTMAENPTVDVHLTGLIMMNAAFPEASERDFRTLIPLMLALVIVALGLLLRAVWGTVVTILGIGLAIAVAMGTAGWMGIALSPTSVAAPNIILTVAIAYAVHILTTLYQGMRGGLDRHAAIVESLRINLQPLFLASATTIIGFLSLNTSDAPPFRDLGNITAIGVAASFVLAVVFLPALLAMLPLRVKPAADSNTRLMSWLADLVIRRRDIVFWSTLASIVLLLVWIPRNELNDEYVKYFDETVDFRRATDFATERLTGIYYIDYSLGTGRSEGISDPRYLADLDRFADWLRVQPGVMHVNSIADIFKRINQNMHGDDAAQYQLPEQADLAAQYLLLYEMSLPYGLDLNDRINVDKSATRLTVTLESLSSQQVLAFEQRAQDWLAANTPSTMHAAGASPTVMFAHIGQRNIRSMLTGVAIALVLISLVLVVALRSLKIGLISLIPNLAPIAMGFGAWGLMVGQVGLALSVVAAMTLGIVVDDTVHFLSKYLRGRREQGMSAEQAVHYAFTTAGTAIWVTSLILIAGFAVLAFSSFEINSGMGLLTAGVIALALLADFLFLPTLLLKIEGFRNEQTTTSYAHSVAGPSAS